MLGATGRAAFVVALKVLPLAGISWFIHEYQIDRFFVFVNPGADPAAPGTTSSSR